MDLFSPNNQEMLEVRSDSTGVALVLEKAKLADARKGKCGDIVLMQLATLRSLEEQDLAEEIGNGYIIPTEVAVQLDEEVRKQLGLPPPWVGFFRLAAEGTTNSPSFNIRLSAHYMSGEEPGPFNMKGPLMRFSKSEAYLPSETQWKAITAVEDHRSNSVSGMQLTETQNLQAIARIQEARLNGAEIDLGPFANLDVVEPSSVSIAMTEQESGDAILTPNFGTGDDIKAIDDRLGQVRGKDEGSIRVGDKIIIIDKERMRGVKEVIRNRRVKKEHVETFLKNPSAFIDATLVDLDVGFSARVKGATVFRMAYFGETEASENEWFGPQSEGYTTPIGNGRIARVIKDEQQLKDFEDSFESAVAAGAKEFAFGDGHMFQIENPEETRSAIAMLRSKLQEPTTPRDDIDVAVDPGDTIVDVDTNIAVVDIDDNDLEAGEVEGRVPDTWQEAMDQQPIDPSNLKLNPYSYQNDGIRWILGLANDSFEFADGNCPPLGALMADDMGLGKTFMSLSAIDEYYRRCEAKGDTKRPVLVVAPLSLLENWQDEVDKVFKKSPFSDVVILQANADLRQFKIEGAERETLQQVDDSDEIAAIRFSLKTRVLDHGIDALDQPGRLVLTTYQTLRDYQFSLCTIDWSFVIFDEAQNIKNPNALQTRAAKGLKARFRLAVTGTPVENELRDFWCLFDTARPNLMGGYQWFRKKFVSPIRAANDEERDAVRLRVGEELRSKAAGLMLRRLKEDSLEGMPEKNIWVGTTPFDSAEEYSPAMVSVMDGVQRDRYDMIIGMTRASIGENGQPGAALKGLQALRAVSLHPDCIEGGSPPMPANAKEARAEIARSGKLQTMLVTIEAIKARREKVILFCMTKSLQRFLQVALEHIYGGNVHIINGDTKAVATARGGQTRKNLIRDFEGQDGFAIIVMSPIAAGVGLTVVGANNVIHVERHWNPAKENQATDRVYRIGQTRPVNVYIPVLKHPEPEITSFDENLGNLLGKKIGLRDAIVTPDEVTPTDIINSGVFGANVQAKPKIIEPQDVKNLHWKAFEALVAELLAREFDAQTHLTPTNDYGCDVVVLVPGGESRLIQCKHTSKQQFRGHTPITEIVGARPFYTREFRREFEHLEVFSNAVKFDNDAKSTARSSNVTLHGMKMLKKLLKKHRVTDADIYRRGQSHWTPSKGAAAV